jgi:hypothetical protein
MVNYGDLQFAKRIMANAHKNSAAHIQEKNSSYTAMPTARQKILSTSWNFTNPEAFPFLSAFIISLGVMVNYGDLQFAKRIMVARRSEMSAEWKVRFAICTQSI